MARRGRMGRGVAPTEKAKDFKGTMKKLIRYMASFKIQIFLCINLHLQCLYL